MYRKFQHVEEYAFAHKCEYEIHNLMHNIVRYYCYSPHLACLINIAVIPCTIWRHLKIFT